MHETTQRLICRVAFISLCVLPTIVLAGSVGWRVWPARYDAVLASIGLRVGARIEVDQITTPKPGIWRAEGIRFCDPETADLWASIDWLEFKRGTDTFVAKGGELQVVSSAAFKGAEQWLRNGLLTDIHARFEQFSLARSGAKVTNWKTIELLFSCNQTTGTELLIKQLNGAGRLYVNRDRQTSKPSTKLQLNTGQGTIAYDWLPVANHQQNTTAKFTGQLEATWSDSSQRIGMSGSLAGVSPTVLIGAPGGLSCEQGLTVVIEQLELLDGRIRELRAQIDTNRGAVEPSFLLAAIRQLGCRATTELQRQWPQAGTADPVSPLPFDRLSLHIQLNQSGCWLSGSTLRGGLLASGDKNLLLAPLSSHLSVTSLLQYVATNNQATLFADERSIKLANLLPLSF